MRKYIILIEDKIIYLEKLKESTKMVKLIDYICNIAISIDFAVGDHSSRKLNTVKHLYLTTVLQCEHISWKSATHFL